MMSPGRTSLEKQQRGAAGRRRCSRRRPSSFSMMRTSSRVAARRSRLPPRMTTTSWITRRWKDGSKSMLELRGVLHAGRGDDLMDAAKVLVDIRAVDADLVIVEQPFDAGADVAAVRMRVDGNRIDPRRRTADFELPGIIRADSRVRRGGEEKDGEEGTHGWLAWRNAMRRFVYSSTLVSPRRACARPTGVSVPPDSCVS